MFRKKPLNFSLSDQCEVKTLIIKTVETLRDDGSKVTIVEKDFVDACDPKNFPVLPSVEEFSISNLINAGVPLEQLPINGILDNLRSDMESATSVINQLESLKADQSNFNN